MKIRLILFLLLLMVIHLSCKKVSTKDPDPGTIVIVNSSQTMTSTDIRMDGGTLVNVPMGTTYTYSVISVGEHTISFVGCPGFVCYYDGAGNACVVNVTSNTTKTITLSNGNTNVITVTCP